MSVAMSTHYPPPTFNYPPITANSPSFPSLTINEKTYKLDDDINIVKSDAITKITALAVLVINAVTENKSEDNNQVKQDWEMILKNTAAEDKSCEFNPFIHLKYFFTSNDNFVLGAVNINDEKIENSRQLHLQFKIAYAICIIAKINRHKNTRLTQVCLAILYCYFNKIFPETQSQMISYCENLFVPVRDELNNTYQYKYSPNNITEPVTTSLTEITAIYDRIIIAVYENIKQLSLEIYDTTTINIKRHDSQNDRTKYALWYALVAARCVQWSYKTTHILNTENYFGTNEQNKNVFMNGLYYIDTANKTLYTEKFYDMLKNRKYTNIIQVLEHYLEKNSHMLTLLKTVNILNTNVQYNIPTYVRLRRDTNTATCRYDVFRGDNNTKLAIVYDPEIAKKTHIDPNNMTRTHNNVLLMGPYSGIYGPDDPTVIQNMATKIYNDVIDKNEQQGITSVIMTFGISGAGKTTTMFGRPETNTPGLLDNWLNKIKLNAQKQIIIKEWYAPISIDTASPVVISHGTFSDVRQVIDVIKKRRTYATPSNKHSSRSHLFVTVTLEKSKLVLIDLAGLEPTSRSEESWKEQYTKTYVDNKVIDTYIKDNYYKEKQDHYTKIWNYDNSTTNDIIDISFPQAQPTQITTTMNITYSRIFDLPVQDHRTEGLFVSDVVSFLDANDKDIKNNYTKFIQSFDKNKFLSNLSNTGTTQLTNWVNNKVTHTIQCEYNDITSEKIPGETLINSLELKAKICPKSTSKLDTKPFETLIKEKINSKQYEIVNTILHNVIALISFKTEMNKYTGENVSLKNIKWQLFVMQLGLIDDDPKETQVSNFVNELQNKYKELPQKQIAKSYGLEKHLSSLSDDLKTLLKNLESNLKVNKIKPEYTWVLEFINTDENIKEVKELCQYLLYVNKMTQKQTELKEQYENDVNTYIDDRAKEADFINTSVTSIRQMMSQHQQSVAFPVCMGCIPAYCDAFLDNTCNLSKVGNISDSTSVALSLPSELEVDFINSRVAIISVMNFSQDTDAVPIMPYHDISKKYTAQKHNRYKHDIGSIVGDIKNDPIFNEYDIIPTEQELSNVDQNIEILEKQNCNSLLGNMMFVEQLVRPRTVVPCNWEASDNGITTLKQKAFINEIKNGTFIKVLGQTIQTLQEIVKS